MKRIWIFVVLFLFYLLFLLFIYLKIQNYEMLNMNILRNDNITKYNTKLAQTAKLRMMRNTEE